MKYVCGFMFDDKQERVLLIRKLKPEWQRGRLNGIGGKVEGDEWDDAAMIREFKEEAGIETSYKDWIHTVCLAHPDEEWIVNFFACRGDIDAARSMTDEQMTIVRLDELHATRVIPNLRWLIPMQLDHLQWPIKIIDRGGIETIVDASKIS